MPTCEQCKTRRKSTKRYSLYRLPKILVVHLKRFSPSDRCRQKLSSTVTFPLTGLNLSRYTDSVSNSSYNCYAISNHSGTLYSGHYTAYAKHSQSGQWHSYNDSRVSKCSSSNVISNEAYLLFFELSWRLLWQIVKTCWAFCRKDFIYPIFQKGDIFKPEEKRKLDECQVTWENVILHTLFLYRKKCEDTKWNQMFCQILSRPNSVEKSLNENASKLVSTSLVTL